MGRKPQQRDVHAAFARRVYSDRQHAIAELDAMPHISKSRTPETERALGTPAPLWVGTGLCCEAQGDGVPCYGVDGECETCGRALPTSARILSATKSGDGTMPPAVP